MRVGSLAVDVLADALVLLSVQLALDRFRPGRLMEALALLALAGSLCFALGLSPLAVQAAVYPSTAAVLLGSLRPMRILEGAAGLMCAFAAAAGFASPGGSWLYGTAGAVAFLLLLRRRRKGRWRWNVEISVELGGRCALFPALIDTGNRLREHGSGLPVLIVEERLLRGLAGEIDARPKRFLPYGVLGGSGELACFAPDAVLLQLPGEAARPAPECRVALFPGRIPGRVCALAPPEFAECARERASLRESANKLRRYYHGVFKHKAVNLWSGSTDPQGLCMLHRRERYAASAFEPGGGAEHDPPGACRGRRGALHADRAQPAPGGLHRPQV